MAILLVLAFHFFQSMPPLPIISKIASLGWSGVDLFFVISGFLIGGILLENREALNYYRVFYLRRFCRIVPLYSLVILPALLAIGLGLQSRLAGHSLGHQAGWSIWLFPFFLQNFGAALHLDAPHYLGPAWSLAVEEQFYLLLPLLIRKLRPDRLPLVLVPAIVGAPVLRGVLTALFKDQAAVACYVLLPCRWDALLLGVLCGYAVHTPSARAWWAARLPLLRWTWLLLLFGMACLVSFGVGRYEALVVVAGYTWIALFFSGALLLAVLPPSGLLGWLLSRRALVPVATVSYGLYLLQGPMAGLAKEILLRSGTEPGPWAASCGGALATGLTAMGAAVSWRWLEKPILGLGHRYRYEFGESQTSVVK